MARERIGVIGRVSSGMIDDVKFGFGGGPGEIKGGTQDVMMYWDSTNSILQFIPKTDDTGSICFGNGTKDLDVKIFLGSVNDYVLFDVGNSKTLIASTWATASATGRPFEVQMAANAHLGGWSNAIKGIVTYGAAGYTSGLGSAVNAEIVLSAGTTQGMYCPLESELVAGSGAKGGTQIGFVFCNGSGADVDSIIDGAANLFVFGAGLDAASGKFIDTDIASHTAYGGIRIYIEGVGTRYLAVVSN